MLVTVQVSNRLDGLATTSSIGNEFVKLTFDDSQPIKHIIKKYCEVKVRKCYSFLVLLASILIQCNDKNLLSPRFYNSFHFACIFSIGYRIESYILCIQ